MAATSTSTGIRPIAKGDVHRITSGQVVLDLQTAVKELVENALDAGATTVEVRFKDYGAESVEVLDNGSGISPENYDGVALKHHTSKLSSFSDLSFMRTFGFRGEALSSLCALADVSIITATKEDAPMGTMLELGKDGKVESRDKRVARQRGTTVSISGLFSSLPVRRREFEKNLKREYGKAQALLQTYALISKGVRWLVSNTPKGGRKTPQLSVTSSSSVNHLSANVTALFGVKVTPTLSSLDLELEMEASRSWKDIASSEEDEAGPSQRSFQVVGLISKPMHGNGRTSSDRQFFYINGRPWEGGKVARAFNEVYKSYNSNQFPFVIADFRLPTDAYDVNVSPDKRTIFLHSEAQLVDALKTALDDFFAPSRGTFSVNGPSQPTRPTQTQSKLSHLIQSAPISDSSTNEQTSRQKRPIHNEHNEEGTDEEVVSDAENVEHPAKVARRAEFEEEVEGVEEEGHEAEEEEEAHEGLPAVRDLEMLSSSPPLPTVRMGPLPTPEAVLTVPPARSPPSSDHLLSSSEDEEDDEVMHEGPSQNNTILGNANSVRQRPTSLADSMRNGSGLSTRGLASSTRLFITPRWGASGSRNAPNATSRAARADLSDTLREFAMPGSQLGTLLVEQDSEGAEEEDENEEDEEVLDETARDDVPEDHLEQDDIEEENNKNVDPATLKVSQSQNLGCCSHDDGSGSSTSHAVAPNAGIADSSPPERERQPSENEERERHIAQLDEDPSTSLSTDIATTQAPQDEILSINQEGETVLPFSLSDLARRLARRAEKRRALDADPDEASPNEVGNGDDGDRALGEGISAAGVGVQDSEKVERELSRVIHKADFETMQIAGQFNLGFIIARRRQRIGGGGGGTSGGSTSDAAEEAAGEGQWMDDLFIVDQHAADEKYNFETLQAETRIRSQKLISPRTLELSASDELVAAEHVDALRANGFEITIDELAMPGTRVKLLSQPVSKDTVFGVKDLEELLYLLRDVPAGSSKACFVRCSKARAMFASRACRKSVMIGRALNKRQMGNIVRQMGTIDQPWNCPHGRPTMRHLVSLGERDSPLASRSVLSKTSRRANRRSIDWSAI